MAVIDIFNGDADGICALLQLRLYQPQESKLITGVKRDIQLLRHVQASAGDRLTVLDISYQKNAADVERILSQGASIFYCDHHQSGDVLTHPKLITIINTHADVCTSLLINGYLQSQYALWAVVGAYGDNLFSSAQAVAKQSGIHSKDTLKQLEQLGTAINYNAYGVSESDLHFKPADLYRALLAYQSPLECIKDSGSVFEQLWSNYQQDLYWAEQIPVFKETAGTRVYLLPDAANARRVSGVFANFLARQCPDKAHAVLNDLGGFYQVSVRAPINNKQGAAQLCSQFPTGGGREAAAGINRLEQTQMDSFLQAMIKTYG